MDETLNRYRESIDNIDAALVFMLAERFKITQDVGRYKAEHALPPADPGRTSSTNPCAISPNFSARIPASSALTHVSQNYPKCE